MLRANIFIIFFALLSFTSNADEPKYIMKVGQKRTFSSKNYVLFESLRPAVVKVERDIFTKNLKIIALKPGIASLLLQEVGMPQPRQQYIQVEKKDKKVKEQLIKAKQKCFMGQRIYFGKYCSFVLPGWSDG